jgi:hypothetical protein
MKAFLMYTDVFSSEHDERVSLAVILPEQCLTIDVGSYVLMQNLCSNWGVLLSDQEMTHISLKYGLKYGKGEKGYMRVIFFNPKYERPKEAVESVLCALSRLKGTRGIVYHVEEAENSEASQKK